MAQITTNTARSKGSYLKNFSDLFDRINPTGLVPPQCVDVERSLLGAMLIDSVAMRQVLALIKARSEVNSPFYRESHFEIYRAIFELEAKNEPVDMLTVRAQIQANGVLEEIGGVAYLIELTTDVITTSNAYEYAKMVLQSAVARELIRICEDAKLRLYSQQEDPFEICRLIIQQVTELDQTRFIKRGQSMLDIANAVLENTKMIHEQGKPVTGIPSGLVDLDAITLGWQKTDLIILAARPSMGKTALALSFARSAALNANDGERVAVGMFSLEMNGEQLVMRMICSEGGVNSQHARKAKMSAQEWKQFMFAHDKLSRHNNLWIDDTSGISPVEFRSKAQWMKQTHNVGLIVVDYLQLMEISGKKSETRDLDIGVMTRTAKAVAKDLNIPVIVLSQLNRGVESRTDKRPMLSDLRESGNIENDADIVLMIYRPEVYDIDTFHDGVSTENVAEIIIAKHRNGPIGSARVKFEGSTGRFDNLVNMPSFETTF